MAVGSPICHQPSSKGALVLGSAQANRHPLPAPQRGLQRGPADGSVTAEPRSRPRFRKKTVDAEQQSTVTRRAPRPRHRLCQAQETEADGQQFGHAQHGMRGADPAGRVAGGGGLGEGREREVRLDVTKFSQRIDISAGTNTATAAASMARWCEARRTTGEAPLHALPNSNGYDQVTPERGSAMMAR